MSSGAVRDAFETAWLTLMPTLPLVDTINDEPDRDTLPDEWVTLDFISPGETRESLGDTACRRERGTIIPIVFVKAGSGSAQAIILADSIKDAFRDWADSTGKISITAVSPGEFGDSSDGRWMGISINLDYVYDQYI